MSTPSPADRPHLVPVPPAPADDRGGVGRLPAPLTPLVGREREVVVVRELLVDGDRRDAQQSPAVRLLTLTGPGGVGKTRLAIEVAGAVAADFADGVGFVELAAVRDRPERVPDLMIAAIGRVLGVRERGTRSVLDGLRVVLRDRHLLLVLDNFEHVLAAAPSLAELLALCPRLVALVTSRTPLRLSGERLWPVPPLALPDRPHASRPPPSAQAVIDSAAVALFCERARAAVPGFRLTDADAAAVAEICRRLDGLPLAIELAAALVRLLPPPMLLARLERRLPLLAGGPRDQPDRLQTMRGAIAWSYDLLAPAEQALFRGLAVFVGGFPVDAAERVLSAQRSVPRADDSARRTEHSELGAEHSVFDRLQALVDQSLLAKSEWANGAAASDPRFGMLETIREFGLERLAEHGEAAAARDAHAAFFLALAERVEPDLYGGRDLDRLLNALDAEHPNLRAALTHLLESGAGEESLRLAGSLAPFWLFHSHRSEGRAWIERALTSPPAGVASAAARARAVGGAAMLAFTQGDHQRAVALAEENLELRRTLGDRLGIAMALNLLGAVERAQGNADLAAPRFDEAFTHFQDLGDSGWMALARLNLGVLVYLRGDLGRAAGLLEEAVALYRQAGDRHAYGAAVALSSLALVTCDQGDHRRAATLFGESLARWREVGTREVLVDWLARVATLAAAGARNGTAGRLFGAADALREAIGYAFEVPEQVRYERARAAAGAALGESAFRAAWMAGHDLAPEEATAEAVALLDTLTVGTEPAGAPVGVHDLTQREREILRLLIAGRSDKEIAAALFITRRTASKHVSTILAKLGVPSRAAAAAAAVRDRLV